MLEKNDKETRGDRKWGKNPDTLLLFFVLTRLGVNVTGIYFMSEAGPLESLK